MLVNIFDGVWNNGYLMPGGRNLIVGSSNGDIRQWKGYGWLGWWFENWIVDASIGPPVGVGLVFVL